ncbi:MAG: hypothetical protein ACKKL4_00875 [Patescibacteria group bacterium]
MRTLYGGKLMQRLAVIALIFLFSSTGTLSARTSDACFIDPRETIGVINEIIKQEILRGGFYGTGIYQFWHGKATVEIIWKREEYLPQMIITGVYKGSPVRYINYGMDERINEVTYRGKRRPVTFDAESDACEIYKRVMETYGIKVERRSPI